MPRSRQSSFDFSKEMISDDLNDAIRDIDRYLETDTHAYPPQSTLTRRIVKVRKHMQEVQTLLDSPSKVVRADMRRERMVLAAERPHWQTLREMEQEQLQVRSL